MDARENAEEQLRGWMERWADPMLRTCYLYLGDRALAEDALQDTWIKVWTALHREDLQIGNEKAWLMTVALNTCRDYARGAWARHNDRRRPVEELPEALLAREGEDRSLSLAVMALPPKEKQAVLLYYYHGLTLKETARALETSVSAVNRRLRRAEDRLRKQWKEGEEE